LRCSPASSSSACPLAAQTAGFTGGDLERLLNEGALLATRRRRSTIGERELVEAILRVIAGPQKKHGPLSDESARAPPTTRSATRSSAT